MNQSAATLRAIPGGRRSLSLAPAADLRDGRPVICPDCPTLRHPLLQELLVVGAGGRCGLACVVLDAREELPSAWKREHSYAIVRRGVIVRQRLDSNGRTTAVDAAGSGCLIPLTGQTSMGGLPLEHEAPDTDFGDRHEDPMGYAATDTRVCLLPTATVPSMLARHDAARAFLWLTSHTLQRVERIAHARARTTADARLAAVLLALADTLSPLRVRDVIPADLLQRDLGTLAALRTESVCRSLQALSARGAIERTEEGTRILDRAALESL